MLNEKRTIYVNHGKGNCGKKKEYLIKRKDTRTILLTLIVFSGGKIGHATQNLMKSARVCKIITLI